MFVSTHLIGEFEGLIDEFTILDLGRAVMTMGADEARARYKRILLQFRDAPPALAKGDGVLEARASGRTLEVLTDRTSPELTERLRALGPEEMIAQSLSLEEIFVATGRAAGRGEAAK